LWQKLEKSFRLSKIIFPLKLDMLQRGSKKMCRVLFAEYLDMNCNKKNKNIPFDIKLFSLQFIKNHIFLQKLGLFPRNITTIFRVLDAEIFIFSPHHLKSNAAPLVRPSKIMASSALNSLSLK